MAQQDLFKPYPISVQSIFTTKLSIQANIQPNPENGIEEFSYSVAAGHSEYDTKKKIFTVGLKLETIEENDKSLPYILKIEILGIFKVDEKRFERKYVEDWARRNAPLILYPYLREHAYALTTRCGFRPFLLPLVEVPSFRVELPKKSKGATKAPSKRAPSKKARV